MFPNTSKGEIRMRRGDIYYIDIDDTNLEGSEQGGDRPCVIIQNDVGNKYSPTVIVAFITSKTNKKNLPTHVEITKRGMLTKDSVVLAEQIRTVDKRRLRNKIAWLDEEEMRKVDDALRVSIGLN